MTGKNYFFSTFNTLLLLACLLLQVKGYAQPACTATSISTFTPATGPEGALVTITGQGFSLGAGTTAVQFNGINAVFRAVSDTQIKATVPAGYTTGDIVVITNGCSATRPGFTLLSSVCAPDIYISELYDANGGSYGVIELYNPADTDLVFNGRYVLERYGTIGDDQPSNNYVLVLPGVIASQTTYQVISNNGSPVTCGGTRDASMGSGINASDQFKLRKDGEVIDVANAPGNIGYTVKRRPNVIAPKVAQTNADWIFTSNTCDDIGDHNPGTPPDTNPRITDEPDSIVLCDMQPTVTFSVTISNTAGATYQWKTVNASGAWVNVSGAGFSGATTRTLTVTVPAPPHTSQYYCVITTPNCVLISDAAQLTVSGRPQATFAVSDINCTTNTGTITLTPTPASGAGLTYSLNGGTFQASATFTNVAGGTHTVTVKNADGCTTAITGIQITIPTIPATTIAPIVLPSCINLNGILTITAPLGAAYEYSTDGTNFQAGLIFNLPAGSYSITVKNILTGCTSVSGPYVIAAPLLPPFALATPTDPTCNTINGSLVVTSPLGTDYEYSVDGVTFQAGLTFTLPQGSYPITVRNTLTGCTSVSLPYIIAPAPAAPAKPEATLAQPDCTNANGSLTVTTPLGTDYEYSVDGTNFQPGIIFTLPQGSYPITVRNTLTGCTSVSLPYIIAPAPTVPAQAQAHPVAPTCTNANGSLTVTTPIGADYEYSVDGTNFQPGVLFTLPQGSYPITVRNTLTGCTSVSLPYIIAPAPTAPAQAQANPVAPTCTNANGSLTVTTPLGTDYEYSVDGTNFQPGVIFNLPAGTYTVTTRNTVSGCTSVSDPYTINTAPTAPAQAQANPVDPTCTNANGSLTVTTPLGTDYEYSVDGTNFQPGVIFTLASGTYTITTRNVVSGCTSVSGSYTINAAPAVVVPAIATPAQPDCSNPNGSLTVTNPLGTDYEYSTDGTNFQTAVAFNLPAGTYIVTTRNTVSGCTSVSDPYIINAAPAVVVPAIATSAQPDCSNPNGSLTVTNPLGTDYEYSVDGINFQAGVAFTLTAGTYTVTTRNTVSGCTSVSDPYTINAAPTAPAQAQVNPAQPDCTNANGLLTVTTPVGTDYEYSVDGINFQAGVAFTLTAGTYTITTRNVVSGCTSVSGSYIINAAPVVPPAATAVVTAQPTCASANGTLIITPPAGTGYEFSTDGINFRTNTTLTLPSGSYMLTVRNASGCTAVSGPYVINPAPAAPAAPLATVIPPDCFNATGLIMITSPAGTGYEYSIDGINFQASATFAAPEGSYTITVRNAAGCTAVSASPAVVGPQPAMPAVAQVTVTLPTCTNALGALTVTSPVGTGYEYSLDGINFQTSTLFAAPQGSYSVTVRNAAGCTATSGSFTIGAPQTGLPELGGLQDCRPTINGNNYILEGIAENNSFNMATATFEWRRAGQAMVLSTDTTFNVTEYKTDNDLTSGSFPIDFELTVTTPGGCTDTYTFTVISVVCDIPKGISPNNDTMNDKFDLAGMDVTKITIVNRYGVEVYHRRNYRDEWHGQTDNGQELPTGTYFYMLEMAGGTRTGWVYLNREVR